MVKGGDEAVDSSVARLILCLTPPHLHMRQRSASSGINNGRASDETGLWDCGDIPEGQLSKLEAHAPPAGSTAVVK